MLVLVNPRARAGDAPLDPALAVFAAGGVEVAVERFASPGELAAAVRRRGGAMDAVVVCGGDGTLRAAARAVVESGLPLGILPGGTGNDLARTLAIPEDPAAAATVVVDGRTRRIDLGEVNGELFFNVASIGLSVEVARRLSPVVKRRFGRLGYALAAVRALAVARPFHATLVDAGRETRVRTLQVAVGNGRHYGGGSVVAPGAAIDDGRLDLYSLEVARAWKLALMGWDLRRGTHGAWQEVRTADGAAFEVRTRRPRAVSADGEVVTTTPARFVVRPGAIAVFAPPVGAG
jgi:YegS/Rv2252/BmrU family lipid kinase